jgi:pilus assembly protein CpaB
MPNIIKIGILIVGAILIALVVRVVVASVSRPSVATVNTEKVRIASDDLPQGLLMREDDLKWKDVALEAVPAGAIVSGVPGAVELKGALLRHPVAAGTVLVADDVILPNAPGFLAATLKPGMRAVSVAVDDVSGNAGLIQPGDYVDLLLTQQMDHKTEAPDLAVSSETVVEHVRVLASGSDIIRPKSGNMPDHSERARTVTIEVTPHMGEVVAVAARLGSLSLALRSFATVSKDRDPLASGVAVSSSADAGTPDTTADTPRAPVWAGDISRALRDLPRARAVAVTNAPINVAAARAPKVVTVYRGSEKPDTSMGAQPGGTGTEGLPPLPVAR